MLPYKTANWRQPQLSLMIYAALRMLAIRRVFCHITNVVLLENRGRFTAYLMYLFKKKHDKRIRL
jgi:hypothetical protein